MKDKIKIQNTEMDNRIIETMQDKEEAHIENNKKNKEVIEIIVINQETIIDIKIDLEMKIIDINKNKDITTMSKTQK